MSGSGRGGTRTNEEDEHADVAEDRVLVDGEAGLDPHRGSVSEDFSAKES